ncbi:hypothetical protein [Massilia sp. TS11]|uniref:hypothetical protein n=1 Tax=Massilia sp. TS11 TaxID=2908003 RepID=UPI001EDA3AAC|nr:hypothetical protein [Massilia sp. TS11]MCG2585686.1 hypothetical protein [Massilia sp. TS11]
MKMIPLLLLLAASAPALAQDAALQRCRAIGDASARLACYDAIAVATPAPAARPAAPAAAAASMAPAAAPAAKTDDPRVANFGIEQVKKPGEQLDVIETSIKGYFEGWRPNLAITLANGQVWRVVDDSDGLVGVENPRVVLRRGMLGAVYMEFDQTNKSPRVRRIR